MWQIKMGKLVAIITAALLYGFTSVHMAENNGEFGDAAYSTPYYKCIVKDLGYGINDLHQINIGDVDGLRDDYRDALATDAVMLYSITQREVMGAEEKERIQSLILLMSVQNEKYPVVEWINNEELMASFVEVQKQYPTLLKDMRKRNWDKPMWVE